MRRTVMGLGLGCVVLLSGARGQTGLPSPDLGQEAQPHVRGGLGDKAQPDSTMARLQEQQAKSRNQDRQKKLEEDTAKLYALAGELKDEVAKSNKDTLSLDVIKKSEEIERLAHSVKEKMKG